MAKKQERLKKGNEWVVCVACGHREQRPVAAEDAQPAVCPECGQQVLNVETKATKDWAN